MKPRSILYLSLAAAVLTIASFATVATAQLPVTSFSQQSVTVPSPAALQGVTSYTIYYGSPSADAINKLSGYDMAVIEPRLWSREQLSRLTSQGVKVLGYLSVLEQYKDSSLLAKATDGDYLRVGGERHYRTEWDSWSMDINSAHYRGLLMEDYRQQIADKGLYGVFLDTVGNVDDGIWPQDISERQRQGVVSFMQELRAQYPQSAIMQNWGIAGLKDHTSSLIDGILWENFTPNVVKRDQWSQNRMQELDQLQANGLMVFIVKAGASTQKLQAQYQRYFENKGYVGQLIPGSYDRI